jgi:hypothetical protein
MRIIFKKIGITTIALSLMLAPFAMAKSLYIIGLTGQSNSLGTLGSTPDTMLGASLGSKLPETTNWVSGGFWYDNFMTGSVGGINSDTLMGASSAWGPVISQPNGTATNQVFPGKGAIFWGPEVGMARCATNLGLTDFAIVKASRGGGGNSFWEKSSTDHHAYTKILSALQAATAQLPSGYTSWNLAALAYLQGESNSLDEANIADTRFTSLLGNLQADLKQTGTRAVIGEISASSGNTARLTTIAKHKALVASAPEKYAFVPSSDQKLWDGLHYNADGQLAIGCRYAYALAKLGTFPNSLSFSQNEQDSQATGIGGFSFGLLDSGYVKLNAATSFNQQQVQVSHISLRSGGSGGPSVAFDNNTRLVIYGDRARTLKISSSNNTNKVDNKLVKGTEIVYEFSNLILDPSHQYYAYFESANGQITNSRLEVKSASSLNSTTFYNISSQSMLIGDAPRIKLNAAILN